MITNIKHLHGDQNDDSTEAPRLVINYTIPGDDPYYYLTEIVVPTDTDLTTSQYQATSPDFAADGTGSCGNDFGIVQADLVTVKTLTGTEDATPNIGDTVEFTITVTNNGQTDATSVSLTDLLPRWFNAYRKYTKRWSV